ncbi:MAG: ECF transporter S component [Thermovenabulum sp.]|uniref:ECF transporter S component n=1 Tax=Thermovenabulum sp. TaxID=3100335 RepID=UPI003C7C0056
MNDKIKKIALLGLFLALTIVATSILKVPVPTFNLYFHLGESIIYLTALIFGGIPAAIIGGVGSALADLIAGYPMWAPITLFIKGIEGFIAGSLAAKGRIFQGLLFAGIFMIASYATAAGILYGIGAVPIEIAGDSLQVSVGAIIAALLHRRLKNISFNDEEKF